MKIYFAASIRGGREDALLYKRMIEHLKDYGRVLTEHVGDLSLQESAEDMEIYRQDRAWLEESNVVIAECSCPSLGVGYELAYAEKCGKPCYVFYDSTKTHLSAMISGNLYFRIYPYEREEDIFPILDEIFDR